MAQPDAARVAALEAELVALRAEMQDFAYTVSHDLRAPLRHILSYVQLAREDAGPVLSEEVCGFLDTASDSARHMGLLLDGLLELSRLGAAPLSLDAVPLQPLVQELVDELARQQAPRRIDWQVQADLPAVTADAQLLRRALHCLLDNAVKFTAQRPAARIQIAVQVGAGPTGMTQVTLEIQDNGAGFNPAQQDRLFRPFARLHTTQQFPGIGMGLALTRKIAQRLGAQVRAEAALDQGCSVYLTLPGAD